MSGIAQHFTKTALAINIDVLIFSQAKTFVKGIILAFRPGAFTIIVICRFTPIAKT
jgi:hypothetical protein